MFFFNDTATTGSYTYGHTLSYTTLFRSRGADAPTAIDLKAMVFASGRQILKASGHSDREAGSIVGRMRKTYSDAVILDVLARCEAERPEVPLEWIQAALSRTRAAGAAPRQGTIGRAAGRERGCQYGMNQVGA